jgi:hypothetical protein
MEAMNEELERIARRAVYQAVRAFGPEELMDMLIIDNIEPADCGCCPENVTVTIKMDVSLRERE